MWMDCSYKHHVQRNAETYPTNVQNTSPERSQEFATGIAGGSISVHRTSHYTTVTTLNKPCYHMTAQACVLNGNVGVQASLPCPKA